MNARITLLILFSLYISSCGKHESTKPNIVLILVDDLGWTDLGCYGSKFHETPNIDRLASESMLFTDAYAACPVCSPTRAAIMSGKYPTRLNITDWIPGDDPKDRKLLGTVDSNYLLLAEITMAELFRDNGYKTFFAGKWHLGNEGYFPEDQGFDINIGGHHRGSPPGGYYVPYKNPKLIDGPEGEYLTDRLTDESIQFLKDNKDEPFFLFLSYYTVHTPIQANKKYIEHYKNKLEKLRLPGVPRAAEHDAYTTLMQANAEYASMVQALDMNVGKLMDAISEQGLSENTIIVFTSDNGGLTTLSYRDWIAPTSVMPLRAGKGWCYEGGIRVPLIIKTPSMKTSATSSEAVISMDLFSTLTDMAGIAHGESQVDGVSLTTLVNRTGQLEREDIFWHYPHYHSSGWTPGAAIRSGKWKLIIFYDLEKTELYDLEADPGENNDLSSELPKKVNELKNKLMQWQEKTGAVFPANNPSF